MIRFLLSTISTSIALPFFVRWGVSATEAQIDKMQEASFNTPGAEAPVPPAVFAGGIALLGAHFLLGRSVKLKSWQSVLSLFSAAVLGGLLYLTQFQDD